MEPKVLREAIEGWTEENCGFEERDYLGMSQIWECPAELYDRMVNGRQAFMGRGARMCYEGLLHETDMIERLQALGVYGPGQELVAEWDERFQGHTDGVLLDGDEGELLLEVKSTTRRSFKEVRGSNRALQRDYEQVQMYLLYGGWERAVIVYKCRETGEVRPIMVWPHAATQERLEGKARRVLEAVDLGERPECECGQH